MNEFTLRELQKIVWWAMEKADAAIRKKLRDTDFYEIPAAIGRKASDEYYRRTREQA